MTIDISIFDNVGFQTVDVAGVGTVNLRKIPPIIMEQINKRDEGEVTALARAIVYSVVDDDGKQVWTSQEVNRIKGANSDIINAFARAIKEVNQLDTSLDGDEDEFEDAVEENPLLV